MTVLRQTMEEVMGWVTDDGLHEAHLAAEFVDGKRASGSNGRGPFVMLYDDAGQYTGESEQRSDDEIVSWRLICHCYQDNGSGRTVWEGPMWARVPTAALEDLGAGRIYAEHGAAQYVDDRADVGDLVIARWHGDHLDPIGAIEVIATAREELAAATKKLNEGVAVARAAGRTWADIGRAAGISRQAAHDRWASTAEQVEAARTPSRHVLRGNN